jgi:hypothetical protein
MSEPQADEVNEGEVLPLEEHDAPQFATVRLVAVQPAGRAGETAWHNERQTGQTCPVCGRHKLKRAKNRVYCGFCREAWWSKKPYEAL